MITADQIQTILNHASKAPTTVGQALNDSQAFAAIVAIGQGLTNGKRLVWADAVDSKDITA